MPWLMPAAVLLVVGVISLRRSQPAAPVSPGRWVDPDAPRRIREMAGRLGWPELGEFLVAVAYWESRGNAKAGNNSGNAARGWFGMRPKSARVDDLGLGGNALKDEPLSVALAAWYASRLRSYAAPGQSIDWLALRRGWYLPTLVDDVNEIEPASAKVREAFAEALAKVGIDPRFMTRRVDFSPWPGIEVALARVGA